MTALKETLQTSAPGRVIELFVLDASAIGGPVEYWTPHTKNGDYLLFNGQQYTAVQIEAEGFDKNGTGTLPQPKLRIANVLGAASALVANYADLLGSKITRYVTFSQYLDDGETPDPTAVLPPDVYTIDRKSQHTRLFIEFELRAVLDMAGTQLPRRAALRDACDHIYRKWNANASAFDYSKATCPYTGSACYNTNGQAVTSDKDVCGKKISDCVLRFGEHNELPGRFFPGMSMVH